MKTQRITLTILCALMLGLASVGYAQQSLTEFTWSGLLTEADEPLAGDYDLRFALFSAAEGGSQLGSYNFVRGRTISVGHFHGTLDFGIDIFDSETRWLEVAYKPAGAGGPYRTLWAPRHPVLRTHHSVMAECSGFYGGLDIQCPVDIGSSRQLQISREGAGIFGITLKPTNITEPRNEWTIWNMDGTYGNDFEVWQYPLNLQSEITDYIPRLEIQDDGDTYLVPSGGNVCIGPSAHSSGHQLDITSYRGQPGNSAIRARYPGGGKLEETEFGALAHRDGAWYAVYAKQGAASYAGRFVGDVKVEGMVRCNSIQETSDGRFKTNVEELDNVLNKIERIRGVSFEWNDKAESVGAQAGQKQIGVVAQEVEAVFPELVASSTEGYKSVDYTKLTAVLIEAVKELKAENDSLKKRFEVLENTLE